MCNPHRTHVSHGRRVREIVVPPLLWPEPTPSGSVSAASFCTTLPSSCCDAILLQKCNCTTLHGSIIVTASFAVPTESELTLYRNIPTQPRTAQLHAALEPCAHFPSWTVRRSGRSHYYVFPARRAITRFLLCFYYVYYGIYNVFTRFPRFSTCDFIGIHKIQMWSFQFPQPTGGADEHGIWDSQLPEILCFTRFY